VSLRARLVAMLLAIAAVGLIVLATITYATQRSFLEQRVDDQARAGQGAVLPALEAAGVAVPHDGDDDGGHRPPRRGIGDGDGDGGPDRGLPPGTYAQLRGPGGQSLGQVLLGYDDTENPSPPRLPASIPDDRLITVPAVGDAGLRYRVSARPLRDGTGQTVVAVPLSEVDRTLHRLLLVEALVIAGVLGAIAALAWWLVGLGLRPLERMGETAGAIAAGDLSRRVEPADDRTEVGRLGRALNAMLVQIERAFAERRASEDRLRRFLADASHELRTPLASIRGYAELFRMGAVADRAEAERAMGRIEDESARMGVLVEGLMTLARLDEVPAADHRPVDLAELAADAAADARAMAPDRPVTVEVGEDPAVVSGDPDQLRQVLANLVRNALVHTPPCTPVELRVNGSQGGRVEVEVRDHGPGLPTDDPAALFERFWRAEPGRRRGPAGAGLGLAIVAGIVHAHGGEVEAADAPGGGARFVVRLPAMAVVRAEA
jgi:two-component system OmpR family sensor kinase